MPVWPLSLTAPRRALPPVGRCRGTRPNRAAKLRPLSSVPGPGAKAATAPAATGPMPGMAHRRLSSASVLGAASRSPASRSPASRSPASRSPAARSPAARSPARTCARSARGGARPSREPGPASRRPRRPGHAPAPSGSPAPRAATRPNSARCPRSASISCVRWRTTRWRTRRWWAGRWRTALRLGALDRLEAHGRARGRLRDRLRIGTAGLPPRPRWASRGPPARGGPRGRAPAPPGPGDGTSRTPPSPPRSRTGPPTVDAAAAATSPGCTEPPHPAPTPQTWKLPFGPGRSPACRSRPSMRPPRGSHKTVMTHSMPPGRGHRPHQFSHLHRGPSRHRRGRDPGPARGQRRRECRVLLDPLAASHPPDAHVALVGETVPRTVSRSSSTLDGAGRHLSRALAVPPTITPASCRPRIGSGAGSTAQNSTRSSASGSPCASASSRCASCTRPRPSSTPGSRRLEPPRRRAGPHPLALRPSVDRERQFRGPPAHPPHAQEGFSKLGLTRRRVLTWIRPRDAAVIMPRARVVVEDRVQVKAACSEALRCELGVAISSRDGWRRTAPCPLPRPAPSRPTPGLRRRGRSLADAAPRASEPSLAPRSREVANARTIRALLSASATRTSISGLRASVPPTHVPGLAATRTCRSMTTLSAPRISRRRSDRSSLFVVAPRRCLPLLECCRGARPSPAAKSRTLRGVSGGGASVASAVAISGPMPGIVLARPPRGLVLARPPRGLAVQRGDALLEVAQTLDQTPQRRPRRLRQAALGRLDQRDQAAGVPGPLRGDLPELRQVTAERRGRALGTTRRSSASAARSAARARETPMPRAPGPPRSSPP